MSDSQLENIVVEELLDIGGRIRKMCNYVSVKDNLHSNVRFLSESQISSLDNQAGVYFVVPVGSSACKIGMTTSNLRGRLVSLQTGNHRELKVWSFLSCPTDMAIKIESSLHGYYTDIHLHGEWFLFEEIENTFVHDVYPEIERAVPSTALTINDPIIPPINSLPSWLKI